MNETKTPVLFLSHGAPTLIIEDRPAKEFMRGLGPKLPPVRAVLCVSAHWETSRPSVNAVERPATIHDFSGFPERLYSMKYPAPGSPEVAREVASLLSRAGITCDVDSSRGLDHGAWVPLSLMLPRADTPVVQLSIQHHLDPAKHYELGRALTPLRERGVLILGSGGAVHPLGYFTPRFDGSPPEGWATEFESWLTERVEGGDHAALVAYRAKAPYPERAHPRPDHYMPLLVAAGAAGRDANAKKIHESWQWGDLGMGAYEFR